MRKAGCHAIVKRLRLCALPAKGKYVDCGAAYRDTRAVGNLQVFETSPLVSRQRSYCTGILVSAFPGKRRSMTAGKNRLV